MKKLICITLALLMLLSLLVSCGGEEAPEQTEAQSSETVSEEVESESTSETDDGKVPLVALPAATDYKYEFRILSRGTGQREDFFADEMTNDIVEQSVYARNQKLKSTYGVTLTEFNFTADGSVGEVSAVLSSGEDTFDLIAPHGRYASSYALQGYCTDWYTLPYCNLTYDWWSQGARECFTINERLYFLTGDICHLSAAGTYCVMFNKDALDDAGIDYPYQMVKDGTWTFETMSQYALQCADDVDGDGAYVLHEDRMGYITYRWGGTYCAFFSSGNRIVKTDANGAPYVSIAENTTAYDALVKFYELCNNEKCYLEPTDGYAGGSGFVRNSLFVFYDTTVQGVTEYRESDVNYGIVPYPKTAEDVEGYVSHSAGAYNQLIVPYTVMDLERTSAVLELLAQEGRRVVRPAYYENVVQKRTSKDIDDLEMLDYIVDARIYDMGYFFGTLGAISSLLMEMSSVANPTAETFYSRYSECLPSANENLQKILEAYSK